MIAFDLQLLPETKGHVIPERDHWWPTCEQKVGVKRRSLSPRPGTCRHTGCQLSSAGISAARATSLDLCNGQAVPDLAELAASISFLNPAQILL